jgi:hypothetical protein
MVVAEAAEAEGFTAGAFMAATGGIVAAMAGIIAAMPAFIEASVVIGATGGGGTGPVGAITTRINVASEPITPGPSHSVTAGAFLRRVC